MSLQTLKSKKEIKAKIVEEKKQRKNLPERSFFGTNNWQLLENNIVALEWILDNYDIGSVKDKIEDIYDQYDESDPDFQDSDYEEMSDAVTPYEWVIGDREDF